MADSSISITQGSGTAIDVRTEATNGNARQVVVLGDPSTNAGVAPVDATYGVGVDVTRIAAGDNNIGNVDLASAIPAGTNNIGDVDVLSVPADPFGTNADAAATAGSTGSIQAKLRLATSQLDAIKTAVEALDNVVSGSEAQVDVVTLPSDPLGASADAAATAGSTGTLSAKQRLMTSQLDAIKTAVETLDNAISGSEMQVDVVGALPAGTNAIGKLAANSGVDIGDVDVTSITGLTMSNAAAQTTGDEAHDAPDAGNPIKIGAKAETSPKGITLVADGDRTNLLADADGMLMVKLNTSGADLITERVSNTDGASTAFTNFSAVASTYNYVTAISVYNSSATSVYIDFRTGTGGAILYTVAAPAGGGCTISGGGLPLFKTAANNALAFDGSAAATTVYISVTGYQSKV